MSDREEWQMIVPFAVILAVIFAVYVRRHGHESPPPEQASLADVPASTAPMEVAPPPTPTPAPTNAHLTGERVLSAGSSTTFRETLIVDHGATLRIEPGAKLMFAQGTALVIQGTLDARGTDAAPIVLTYLPDGGLVTWVGVVFGEEAMAGSILDHATIAFAGERSTDAEVNAFGAITVSSPPRAITISHVDVMGSMSAGVQSIVAFAAFDHNTISGATPSLDLDADVMSSLGEGNVFAGELWVSGRVTHSAKWPKIDVPIQITGSLDVDGRDARAVLELASGTELRFVGDAALRVGRGANEGFGGSLIADHSVFVGFDREPWRGIQIFGGAWGTSLVGCVIDGSRIGVTIFGSRDAVVVRDTTFLHTEAAFHSTSDRVCGALDQASAGNHAIGARLCRHEALPSEDE